MTPKSVRSSRHPPTMWGSRNIDNTGPRLSPGRRYRFLFAKISLDGDIQKLFKLIHEP